VGLICLNNQCNFCISFAYAVLDINGPARFAGQRTNLPPKGGRFSPTPEVRALP